MLYGGMNEWQHIDDDERYKQMYLRRVIELTPVASEPKAQMDAGEPDDGTGVCLEGRHTGRVQRCHLTGRD